MDQSLLGRLRSQREAMQQASQVKGRSFVYVYLRRKDSLNGKAGSPYYVGVARSIRRPFESHRRTPVPSDERCVRMLRSNLTHAQAREWEKYYIRTFGRKDNQTGRQMLLNRTDGGEGTPNPSCDTRAKISAASNGRTHSAETRMRMSETRTGTAKSEEHKSKISEANKGHVVSAETRAKIGAGNRNPSAETRAKISAAASERTFSAETRAKMSAASKARAVSEEVRAKMAASRIRNTAGRLSVDPGRYSALSAHQRSALQARFRSGKRGEDLFRGL